MVTHLLTETDSFSDLHGAALQRWVANVMRFEQSPAAVACARYDGTWALKHVTPIHLPALWAYSKLRGRYRLPWRLRRRMLRAIFQPLLERLHPGHVVWIHNRPDYASALAAGIADKGANLVLHLHNSLMISSPPEITSSLRVDRMIFCSHYLEREAKAAFPQVEGTGVIHNGADERRFYPESRRAPQDRPTRLKEPLVLFAGRLVPEKGAHVFVEAMWLLQARGIRAKGLLLGATGFGSNQAATTYSRSLARNAPANVSFGGYRSASALAEEFRRAQIFCSPSIWHEPFGLVNVEAMASGLPVVSTSGGGVPEIFAEGGAILVKQGSATELAAALEQLIRDPDLRVRLAAEAYASFCKAFTWQHVHRRYREVLSSLH